jgi:PAS domain S-box-containing protein
MDEAQAAERITRLEAEVQELRRNDRVHRILLDSIVDYALITLDNDLRVTSWNTGGERLLGWKAEEIIGQPGELVFVPEDVAQQAPQREAATALTHGRATNERWHLRKDGSRFWGSGLTMPLYDGELPVGFIKVMRDQTERRRSEQSQKLLLSELTHRVKNTLALVQALADQTLRSTPEPAAFAPAFRDRLGALARAHDVLTRQMWDRANITEVIEVSLGAWRTSGRITAGGPEISLKPQQAVTFSLALHELATNAAKYGALSVPNGRVAIAWSGEEEILFTWEEFGGPQVGPPTRTGFGSVILNQALGSTLGGQVQISFSPEGLRLELRFKRPEVSAGAPARARA